MTLTAQALYNRGVELANRGRYAPARRSLEAAGDRATDPDLRARVAGTLSYIVVRNGDPDAAERMCLEALSWEGLAAPTRAILEGQLGNLNAARGRFMEAEQWFTRSVDGTESDPVANARVRVSRSVMLMYTGRLAAATDDLHAAIAIFERLGMESDEAQARHNLGYVEMLAGDLVHALQSMQQARAVIGESSPIVAATCDVDRAEVLRDAGLTTEAERILERVGRVFGAHGMRQARGEAEFNLARSLVTHDPARAAVVAAASARRFRALGSRTWAARAEGLRLRAVLSSGRIGRSGDPTAAIRGVPTEEEVASVAEALEGFGLRGEGAALRMTGELWRARRGAVVADAPRRVIREPRGASMDVKLLAYEVRAARASSAGHEADARRQAAAGLELLSGWQSSFGSLDLQTSTSMHGLGLLFEGLGSAARSRRPDVLFEWSERARHLSQQVIPLRPPPDQGLANDLAELRMLRAENPSGDWLSDPRAAALKDRARERQWAETGSAEVQQRITLREFQPLLGGETAFLSYVFSGETLSCLVVTGARASVVDIGAWSSVSAALAGLRADLDVSAAVRSGPMATVVQRTLDGRLERLSAALLAEPLRVAGDPGRVVVTMPGVLNGVPWAMLPGMRGRVFTLAVSATRWASFRAPDAIRDGAMRTAGFAVGPRVARADEEVSTAAAAWPAATALRGDDATVSSVTGLASAVDVLHVASHGRHAADNPLFSGLELADGTLFGYDIDLMPRVPEAVVLSACEVGRSSVRWGEEALGMTRTWLHAGSRVVIAAPVVVADDVACELLGALHSGLVDGLTPSEALAAASDSTGLVAPFQAHGAGF